MSLSAFAPKRLATVSLAATLLIILPFVPRAAAAGQEPAPGVAPAAPDAKPAASVTPAVPAATPAAPVAAPATGKNPLGATPQEIIKIYGPVLKHNARVRHHQVLEGGTALDGDLHGRNGVIIRVVYQGGHVVLLEFTRVAGALTPADVAQSLASTADGSVWVQGKDSTDLMKFYRRTDDRAIAHHATDNDGSLLIAAEGFDHDKLLDNMMH